MTTQEILEIKYRKVEELQQTLKTVTSDEDRQFLTRLLKAWKSYP
jgi:hypothetical protein